MQYIFPFKKIEKDARIILYGAGNMGYQFFRQIKSTDYCRIVGWVDRQYEWYRKMNLPVDGPESIAELEFDKLIIAAEREETATSIKQFLRSLSVGEDKIVWVENTRLEFDIVAKYDKARCIEEARNAYEIDPHRFLNENRMDLVIRYMYAREIVAGNVNGLGKQLYDKYFITENGAREPMDEIQLSYFTEYCFKNGIKSFEDSFIELINNMQKCGFDKEYFVPLDKNEYPVNGSHRIAAALALNKKVWGYRYSEYEGPKFVRPISWFEKRGFSKAECEEITNIYRGLENNE